MNTPLSEILRPKTLDEVIGQEHLTSKTSLLRKLIEQKRPRSILLYGPPGTGKTTIARIYANSFKEELFSFTAVYHSTSEIKKVIEDARKRPLFSSKIILFIDEIHRFNKSQQDLFLPFIEDGSIVFIGATTENPSFALNNALISRMQTFAMNPLLEKDLLQIINLFQSKIYNVAISESTKLKLISSVNADARNLLHLLENIQTMGMEHVDENNLSSITFTKCPQYDKGGDYHHQLISALHKSIRGSDVNASIYYLSRIIQGGEDPKYIFRRLIRIALEDIGTADPNALEVTLSCQKAYDMLGAKEGELAMAQACVYLSLAPKSIALYKAFAKATDSASKSSNARIPNHLINAPNNFMKKAGASQGYIYDPDTSSGFAKQRYFPEDLQEENFFHPKETGFESQLKNRMEYIEKMRTKK